MRGLRIVPVVVILVALALLWALAWTAWAVASRAAQPRWRVNIASGHCIGQHGNISQLVQMELQRESGVQMELKHCKNVPFPRGHTVLRVYCKPPLVSMLLSDTPRHELTVLFCTGTGVIGLDGAFCDPLFNASLSGEASFTCSSRGDPTVFPYFVSAQRVR